MKIGYIAGTFDPFGIAHVNLLREARAQCDRLVVGVTSDGLASYRRLPVPNPFQMRREMVQACRHVDAVAAQETADEFAAWEEVRFDVLFVGGEWFRNPRWRQIERRLSAVGVTVVCFPGAATVGSAPIDAPSAGRAGGDWWDLWAGDRPRRAA